MDTSVLNRTTALEQPKYLTKLLLGHLALVGEQSAIDSRPLLLLLSVDYITLNLTS